MVHSIEFYIAKCKSFQQAHVDRDPNIANLLAIKELMEFYKKLGERTFLSFKYSKVHHIETAHSIIENIDEVVKANQSTFFGSDEYKRIILLIQTWVSVAKKHGEYNPEGDFANINQALRKCISNYQLYQDDTSDISYKPGSLSSGFYKKRHEEEKTPAATTSSFSSSGLNIFSVAAVAELIHHHDVSHYDSGHSSTPHC